MGHIVDEVVLDLRIPLLTEYHDDGEDKRHDQHERKDHRRNHETDRREDVTVHVGEMNPDHSHLGLRVIPEQHLGIGVFFAVVGVVRTTINLPAILCAHREMIRYIDTIVH